MDKKSPHLLSFNEKLLSYDFYQDIQDDKEVRKEMPKIPLHFDDEDTYINTFEPLFWEEAKAQLHRQKALEMTHSPEIVQHLAFKMEGEWLRLEVQRGKEEAERTPYTFADLVVFTQGQDPVKEDPVHFLAMVDFTSGTKMLVTTKLKEGVPRALAVAKVISKAGSWKAARVMNLSTLMREYESLKAFPRIVLKSEVLNRDDSGARRDAGTEMQAAPDMQPTATGNPDKDGNAQAKPGSDGLLHIPEGLEKWLQMEHNEPQQKAINDCRKVSGITLVQGPPGTGKTKTALGILAVLMNATAKESKAVSYTRIGGEAAARADSSGEEEEEETEEAISKREMERVQQIRQRIPWLRGGFLPWTDTVKQEVPATGTESWRNPFPKLATKDIVPMSEVSENVAPQKVLVCAPSNAGVDEVLRRIIGNGIVGPDGLPEKPSVVRLGPGVHPGLEEYHLQSIVTRRLAALSDAPNLNQREEEKTRLLRDARIVCTTLSVSGSRDVVGFEHGFDTVLVDEASQGVEVSMLVPLKLGCRRLILIGDPKQLPATCFSSVALAHEYDRSLFQRLQTSGHKVNLLRVQYRMHPLISAFPSSQFYDGELRNALEVEDFEKKYNAPWSVVPCFGPVSFFDVKGEMQEMNCSLVNEEEADFVVQLFRTLSALWPKEVWHTKLAVISPYAQQVQLIRQKLRSAFGIADKGLCPVDVNTVDGFQGREKDCIIVSVVRADPDKGIGFLRDRRRMNVAFTRPRTNLWIVGHTKVLAGKKNKNTKFFWNEDWAEFIRRQREAARLLRVPRPFDTFLHRYVRGFFERHPEMTPPPGKLPEVDETIELLQEPEAEEEKEEEFEEDEDEDDDNDHLFRDIEEVEEDNEWLSRFNEDEGEPGEPAQLEQGAQDNAQEDKGLDTEPDAKRQKTEEAAEGNEMETEDAA